MSVRFAPHCFDRTDPIDPDWDHEDRTPSITRVSVDDSAAYVSADTSEWLSHEMADTMKLILVQELTRAGVEAVISPDHAPIRGIDARPWPA